MKRALTFLTRLATRVALRGQSQEPGDTFLLSRRGHLIGLRTTLGVEGMTVAAASERMDTPQEEIEALIFNERGTIRGYVKGLLITRKGVGYLKAYLLDTP